MPAQDTYRSQFRIPWELYEQLKAAADTSGKSLNAELIDRLRSSFESDEALRLTTDHIAELRLATERTQKVQGLLFERMRADPSLRHIVEDLDPPERKAG